MEEERTIKINLSTAKEWYNGDNIILKNLALEAFDKYELMGNYLPKTRKDILYDKMSYNSKIEKYRDKNWYLTRLISIRDIYRQGWKRKFPYNNGERYSIVYYGYGLSVRLENTYHIFTFPTKEIAKQFLENFSYELKQIIDML